jgi:hypothetical protein
MPRLTPLNEMGSRIWGYSLSAVGAVEKFLWRELGDVNI